jgi:hypothetical protein
MSVGTINYATVQGLGILTKAFVDNKVVDEIMVVRHRSRSTQPWYPNAWNCPAESPNFLRMAKEFCLRHKTMFFIETPFHWDLIAYCRANGIRTVLMPMYECMPTRVQMADAIINPSLLDQQYYPSGTFIPVPVDVPWRHRTIAKTFIHNAGNGGLLGRNGTLELIRAMEFVKSDIKLIIRSQKTLTETIRDPRITVKIGEAAYANLFTEGDVFVFPEKFNGLSLPLQEAFASGMLVMCGNRFPMNTWLPTVPLIPVSYYTQAKVGGPYNRFEQAEYDPEEIARTIDAWFERDISSYSHLGAEYAENNTWAKLKPKYDEVLRCV